jgi:hypothetical protein
VTVFTLSVATALFAVVVLLGLGFAWRASRRDLPRRRAYTQWLDAADALEARLRLARSEIEAITGDQDETVRAALQEMLRQRLWVQAHGETASIQRLQDMRLSLDQARARIDQQLTLMERARSPAS